ncbi:MAG: VWA domain-containing protein [Rikenellaceae bacterium]|nr:VWA domain-containing protein [Rikenellaceae bacterium]
MIERFANPGYLWFLFILVPMIGYYIYRTLQGGVTVRISDTKGLMKVPKSVKYYLRHLPFILRCAAVALLIVALARPQSAETNQTSTTEGIDIILSIDISGSMLARDFKPNRMVAAKEVAKDFILDRPNDRIGLVIFAGESFTQSPLTTDKATLINLLNKVEAGMIEDGTAIGTGLATAINRLRESDAKSKVIILLTDGVNNMGQIAPLTAAEIAQMMDIKVYTIGVGTIGTAPYPAFDMWGNITYQQAPVEIDEEVLIQIAGMTGGQYFRATDNNKLEEIYDIINQLETTKIEVDNFTLYKERFMIFALTALIILILEILIRYFYLKKLPQ